MFDQHYPFGFTMNEPVEGEAYQRVLRFSFDGPGHHQYCVIAEEYPGKVFAIKFYLKSHSGSARRYSLLTGFHQAPRIIRTCIEIMLTILRDYPNASFCILGTNQEGESKEETKRFRIYKYVLQNYFSPIRFEHRITPERSLYFLLNKSNDIASLVESTQQTIENYYWD